MSPEFANPNGATDRCEKACKLTKAAKKTDSAVAANSWDYHESTDSLQFIYRLCVNSNCLVEAGETIIKPCSCINDFPEAASTLKGLEAAAKDIICSAN
ncbi:MAG: hypothetical protein M0036_26670 [Desulfobacteraceae bacterium]|nr:hypothetical protein [Desulfobacteraceae bacterium]